MNKIIPIMIISFALIASGALALEPCPLAMKFVTSPPSANQNLEITVSYGSHYVTGMTNEYGEAVVDMGHLGIADCLVQDFDMVVTKCSSDPICHQTVSFNPNGFTTFDISKANLFEEECPPDETPYAQCDSCCLPTSCESCESKGYIKSEDCPVTEQPDYTIDAAVAAIIIFITGLGIGKYKLGVKIYTKTTGEVVAQHTHRNITGYHSINTMHQHQPHKKGEIAPKYDDKKGEDGYYKYLG